jgi:AcrR family transcriptional regulator
MTMITLPTKPRRHWNRRKHARSSEILAAAAEILAEKGPGALKMAAIAERAGVTKGTVYLYFINKADVLARLTQTAAEIAPEPQLQAAE